MNARQYLLGRSGVRTVGILVALTGALVLAGWALDIPAIESIVPGWPKMVPGTALAFLLSGVSLWFAAEGPIGNTASTVPSASERTGQAVALICATVVALIGALKLADYAWGWPQGIDHLGLGRPSAAPFAPPAGSMSPATALNFLLAGSALALAVRSRFIAAAVQPLALLVLLIGWLGFSRYVYGGAPLTPYAAMAIHTALLFLALGAGILLVRRNAGLIALLTSDGAGGASARRLLPAAIVIPLAIGWLPLYAERAGWLAAEANLSLFALSCMILFGTFVWTNSKLLDRTDLQRKRAERKMAVQLERLNLLDQITRAIGERQDLRSIFQVLIRSLEDSLPIDFGCVCLYDPAAQVLVVNNVGVRSAALANELALPEQARIPIDKNGLARCINGELVYEPDIGAAPFPFPQRLARGGLRSLVIAPLRADSGVFGILVAARRRPEAFSSNTCEFLRQLSEHVALAAHQAQLYSALEHAYEDLRETQQAVMQQERLRALGQMASGIAHDINNALSPAALYVQSLLERDKSLNDRTREELAIVRRAIEDVANTVARMREFYRREDPRLTLTAVDLNRMLQQVAELTRARWSDMPQERGFVIHLQTDFAPDLPAILGTESEIRDALTNLIMNAVDAMPEGGTLGLRTRMVAPAAGAPTAPRSMGIQVEVSDTGIGMDEETRSRCLEPFFTTKGARGTGLGLAMVYGMAQRHGAGIEIDSTPGNGATLRLIFPVAVANGAASAKISAPRRPAHRLRLLVVDDDPLLLRSLRDTLEHDGHLITVADGGQAGIDAFRRAAQRGEPFELVITDLGMPHVDGRKLAATVKTVSPATPIVLLTGWGQRLLVENDRIEHIDRVLSKPPKLAQLRTALAELTDASTSHSRQEGT